MENLPVFQLNVAWCLWGPCKVTGESQRTADSLRGMAEQDVKDELGGPCVGTIWCHSLKGMELGNRRGRGRQWWRPSPFLHLREHLVSDSCVLPRKPHLHCAVDKGPPLWRG